MVTAATAAPGRTERSATRVATTEEGRAVSVLFISPGYPDEMALFARALADTGTSVIGLGDQPWDALPGPVRSGLAHHVHVGRLDDEGAVLEAVRGLAAQVTIDRVECLWEPYLLLAARIREALGLPGMSVERTLPFRDKELMKRTLDAAGIRTPWHTATHTVAGVYEAAERIGFPLIVKPISGAGSADTHRVETREELDRAVDLVRHVTEVSVEEFIEAEEFTYDTVCAGREVLFENVCWYRPRPLVTMQNEWISPVTVALRDLDRPELAAGREMGRAVLAALGFEAGFTHMEWYRKADGEVVFGEIGARSPGGRTVDVMNYATDGDLFAGWAHAVVHGRLPQPLERRYNAASIFKRARGTGHITGVEGLSQLLDDHGEHVAAVELLPVGAPRRDWRQTLIGDGMIVVRHPDLETTLRIADRAASQVTLHAG